ncbi:50S ribosomal protein L4 [Patescibacteria group bacterium]|nr:50S ribosomal protein L4 [Patescibacteria group bacterium]MBU4353458.1 50S ribosomal protein L4 [Patescibacteria group bacterium]MCG2699004.1 50S ribosomal protein L4 [Candidatus Parcubacteria bacterium]
MKADIYNQKGEKAGIVELSKAIFDLPWNEDLVHQVIVSMKANKRIPVAHAKGRGDVRGGGKKPWRQKGTGRARHGSTRSPIWRGGGVTHGPTNEKDYSKKINDKMKKKAFFTVLSQKFRDNEILFLDKIILTRPKTKEAMDIIKSISKIKGFDKFFTKRKNRAVIALPAKDKEVEQSFSNIAGTQIFELRNLNPLDLATYKYLVIVSPKNNLFNNYH